MEPEVPLPFSQENTSGSYPDLEESIKVLKPLNIS